MGPWPTLCMFCRHYIGTPNLPICHVGTLLRDKDSTFSFLTFFSFFCINACLKDLLPLNMQIACPIPKRFAMRLKDMENVHPFAESLSSPGEQNCEVIHFSSSGHFVAYGKNETDICPPMMYRAECHTHIVRLPRQFGRSKGTRPK